MRVSTHVWVDADKRYRFYPKTERVLANLMEAGVP